MQDSGKAYTDFIFYFFLQRLVSAVSKAKSDPDGRQVGIETLVFENANMECKKCCQGIKVKDSTYRTVDQKGGQYWF